MMETTQNIHNTAGDKTLATAGAADPARPHLTPSSRPAERPRGDSGDQNNNKDFEGEMCTHTVQP